MEVKYYVPGTTSPKEAFMTNYKKKRLNYTALMVIGIAIVVIDASLLSEYNSTHLLVRLLGTLMTFIFFIMAIKEYLSEKRSKKNSQSEER